MTIHMIATKMAKIAITRIARRLGILGSLIFYSVGEKVRYVLEGSMPASLRRVHQRPWTRSPHARSSASAIHLAEDDIDRS
jgi:hypothetical protein